MKLLLSSLALVLAVVAGVGVSTANHAAKCIECDIDGNGSIGFTEFVAFVAANSSIHTSPNFDPRVDYDRDYDVDFTDYVKLIAHWNETGITRNRYQQPFTQASIWNTPIGQDAVYVDAELQEANGWFGEITLDRELISVGPTDPLKTLTATDPFTYNPNELVRVYSTLAHDGSLNGCATFLIEDGTAVWQGQPLTLTAGGNPSWTHTSTSVPTNITTSGGNRGCHGGSRLSGYGGSLRPGELTGSALIRHALKVNLWSVNYFHPGSGDCHDTGYRWPAEGADGACDDSNGNDFYSGTIPELQIGALLAVPPEVNCRTAFTDAESEKLCLAMQDYGAYIVDNTAWDVHAIALDTLAGDEFLNNVDHAELQELFMMLHVVDSNASDNVGGGGTPRAPLAPPFE